MEFIRQWTTIDAHASGTSLRIITGGLPPVPGKTMSEKRAFIQKHRDDLRKILMQEPRGHHGMYGCI